jgi:pimeloyl-ACP methyl ester carboxylesterase
VDQKWISGHGSVGRMVASPVTELSNTEFLTTEAGLRFALHDFGGSGAHILLCHATGFCGRAYEPLARFLASQFHVWAVDMPGHGDSDLPAGGDFSWQAMVGHVVAAAKAISSQRLACIFGHSMGGAVALQAISDHPDLAAAAYLYEPIISAPSDRPAPGGRNPLAEGARRRQSTFASKQAVLWRYASRPPLNALNAASLAAYVDHGFDELPDGTVSLKCSPESEARTFESSLGITTATVAGALARTLCVTGGEAGSPLVAMVPPLVAQLPNAEMSVHPHLGHFGPLQGPDAIGAEIARHANG